MNDPFQNLYLGIFVLLCCHGKFVMFFWGIMILILALFEFDYVNMLCISSLFWKIDLLLVRPPPLSQLPRYYVEVILLFAVLAVLGTAIATRIGYCVYDLSWKIRLALAPKAVLPFHLSSNRYLYLGSGPLNLLLCMVLFESFARLNPFLWAYANKLMANEVGKLYGLASLSRARSMNSLFLSYFVVSLTTGFVLSERARRLLKRALLS